MKKEVFNSWWLLLDKFGKLAVNTIIGIFILNSLGPELSGNFVTAQNITSIVSVLVSLGLTDIIVRDLVKEPIKSNSIISISIIIHVLGSVASLFLIFTLGYIFKWSNDFLTLNVIFCFSNILVNIRLLQYFNEAALDSRSTFTCSFISLLFSSILKVIGLIENYNANYFAYCWLIDAIIFFVLSIVYIRKQYLFYFDFKIKANDVYIYFKKSAPLALSSSIVYIYVQSDVILVNKMMGPYDAGIYAVATKLVIPLYILPAIIASSFFPRLIKAHEDKDSFREIVKNISAFLIFTSTTIAIFIHFSSWSIIEILFSNDYRESANILSIGCFTLILAFLGPLVGRVLIIEGYIKLELLKNALACILNIMLSIVFIHRYGAIGAIYSTIISLFFSNYLIFCFFKETRYLFIDISKSVLLSVKFVSITKGLFYSK